jgi:hypoxanthine phosphoribosyltransferase
METIMRVAYELSTVPQYVSWDAIEEYSVKIADAHLQDDIVAIIPAGTGAHIPAAIVAHQLGAPIIHLSGIVNQLTCRPEVDGGTVLVIGDIAHVDGRTLGHVVGSAELAKEITGKNVTIKTAALFQKDDSTFVVHTFGAFVDKNSWLVMPWEKG